jgi:sugar lactone lactonase YvrE
MNAHRVMMAAFIGSVGIWSGSLVLGSSPALAGGFTLASSFGESGKGAGQLEKPRGIAVEASSGDVFVVDSGNNRVVKYNAEGTEVLGEFTGAETPQKSLEGAHGVAVDNSSSVSKGDVYVTVVGTPAVVDKFKPKGTSGKQADEYEYVCQLTGPGGGCVKEGGAPTKAFAQPTAVSVDGQGNVYVAQERYAESIIYEFNAEGSDVPPPLEGEHIEETIPDGVAVDASGNIYVASEFGEYLRKFNSGREYQSEVEKESPTAVTVNPTSGAVFAVNSSGGDHVAEYEASGKEIERFGGGQIGESKGIAYSPNNGDVYVTDLEHNEVHIYELAKPFKAPAIKLAAPSGLTAEDATLMGTVDPEGEKDTHWFFAWGETEAYGAQTPAPAPELPMGTNPVAIEAKLERLAPNTTYHYQLFAYNSHDKSKPAGSGDREITTLAIPPAVSGEPASFVGTRSATLLAKVDPEHSTTAFRFQYGTSKSYGRETAAQSAGTGLGSGYVSQRIEGLEPGTTYHFRVVASNCCASGTGASEGPDETFTTGTENAPAVQTGAATGVTQTGATVSGTVDPEGWSTAYALELGTTTTYGTQISGSAGSGSEPVTLSIPLQGLVAGTTYHYRFTAMNRNGMSDGADGTFTTPAYSYTFSLTLPPASLFVPTPTFPPVKTTTTKTSRTLTRAQKLAKALKVCAKQPNKRRASCEKRAHKMYGGKKKTKLGKK